MPNLNNVAFRRGYMAANDVIDNEGIAMAEDMAKLMPESGNYYAGFRGACEDHYVLQD